MKTLTQFLIEGLYDKGSERYEDLKQDLARDRYEFKHGPEIWCKKKGCGWNGMVDEVEATKGKCPGCGSDSHLTMNEEVEETDDPKIAHAKKEQKRYTRYLKVRRERERMRALGGDTTYREGKPLKEQVMGMGEVRVTKTMKPKDSIEPHDVNELYSKHFPPSLHCEECEWKGERKETNRDASDRKLRTCPGCGSMNILNRQGNRAFD